jgi:hypothetical protein
VTTPTNQVPNGTIQQGQIWTPAQWNTAWQSKVDASGGFSTNETLTTPDINDPTIVGGTMSAPTISNPTITGVFTGPGAFTGPVTGANITSGTFTATLTGMTTTVTATATYTIAGNIAVISIPTTTGTSNSTSFTITGLPSALQPATQNQIVTTLFESGSVGALGGAQLTPGSSVITCFAGQVSGATIGFISTGWSASGTKGVIDLSITYQLQ